jgi:hypothetical protein
MRTHKSLKPGKFCRADNCHNLGCCEFSGVDRSFQIFLNGHSYGR